MLRYRANTSFSDPRNTSTIPGRRMNCDRVMFTGHAVQRMLVYSQYGADWIEDRIARQLEDIVKDARKRRLQVEVTSFS